MHPPAGGELTSLAWVAAGDFRTPRPQTIAEATFSFAQVMGSGQGDLREGLASHSNRESQRMPSLDQNCDRITCRPQSLAL
jgi:hypothetical protein